MEVSKLPPSPAMIQTSLDGRRRARGDRGFTADFFDFRGTRLYSARSHL